MRHLLGRDMSRPWRVSVMCFITSPPRGLFSSGPSNHAFELRVGNIEIRADPFRGNADLEQDPLGVEQIEGVGGARGVGGLCRSQRLSRLNNQHSVVERYLLLEQGNPVYEIAELAIDEQP